MRAVAELTADAGAPVAADVYVKWSDQPDSDAMAAKLGEIVAAQPLPADVDRVVTTVAGGGGAVMHHHFTFRRTESGFAEDRVIRGLHRASPNGCSWSGCGNSTSRGCRRRTKRCTCSPAPRRRTRPTSG